MKKINIGDVFEIETKIGLAYLHYIYKDGKLGELIRVLPGVFNERPIDLNELAMKNESFMVFFPVSAAVRKNIIQLAGSHSAQGFGKPKMMRMEHWVRGEFLGWHIVDTDSWKMKLVKSLTEDQKKLSPWGSFNDTLLTERIEENWSLEKWI